MPINSDRKPPLADYSNASKNLRNFAEGKNILRQGIIDKEDSRQAVHNIEHIIKYLESKQFEKKIIDFIGKEIDKIEFPEGAGQQGERGEQGIQGERGLDGVNGKDGLLYEVESTDKTVDVEKTSDSFDLSARPAIYESKNYTDGAIYNESQARANYDNSLQTQVNTLNSNKIGSLTGGDNVSISGSGASRTIAVPGIAQRANLGNTGAGNSVNAATIGVTGTLLPGNGGTGQTSLANVTVGKAGLLTSAVGNASNPFTFNGTIANNWGVDTIYMNITDSFRLIQCAIVYETYQAITLAAGSETNNYPITTTSTGYKPLYTVALAFNVLNSSTLAVMQYVTFHAFLGSDGQMRMWIRNNSSASIAVPVGTRIRCNTFTYFAARY